MDFKLHYFPALVSGWFASAFIISYIVAVLTENVHPFVPYISDLGIWQPSSGIFGQMVNIGSVLVGILVYIRYKQIDFVIKTKTTNLNKKWNEIVFYLGIIFAFGISVVANFPSDLDGYRGIFFMHIIGACMSFGVGGVYLIIQTKITFDIQPYYDRYPKVAVSKRLQYLRLFMTICFAISLVLVMIFANIFMHLRTANTKLCTPDSPEYIYHLVSAIFEWVMAMMFFSYCLTATHEIKFMSFKEVSFEYLIHDKEM